MIGNNYFNKLPREILWKILLHCPYDAAPVCKDFFLNIPYALKYLQWNPLKENENLHPDFKKKLEKIEEKSQTEDGRKLIGAFFRSLHRPQNSQPIKELDFSNVGEAMFAAWQADQDYNLLQCWSRITPKLAVQNLPVDAQGIRLWMQNEENQNSLAQIRQLDLSHLSLTNLPSEIIYFSQTLTELDLSYNQLTELPDTIGELAALTWLDLSNNQLTELPDTITKLVALTSVDLSDNRLTKLPDTIGNLIALTSLYLDGNQLTELPDTIRKLVALIWLGLSNNQLTELPGTIGNLVALTVLDLEGNRLTKLPDTIGNLVALTMLDLSDNQLTELPDAIGNLVALTELGLANNQLTKLPHTIGNLVALTMLYLSNNQLTELPDAIGNLVALTEVYLSGNQLAKLPDAIGNLVALTALGLARNKLTELPDTMGKLVALTQLYLSDNQLTKLPVMFAEIGKNIDGIPNITIEGNILLLIPMCVLDKFKNNPGIENFIFFRNKTYISSLDSLCQWIRKNSDAILNNQFTDVKSLRELVSALEKSDLEKLYFKIRERALEKNNGNLNLEEESFFEDMYLFVSALGELLYQRQKK